jgi:hypothetical protein
MWLNSAFFRSLYAAHDQHLKETIMSKSPTKTITLTKKQYGELVESIMFLKNTAQYDYELTRARHGPRDPVTKSHIYLKALHTYNHIKEAA